MNKSNSMYKSFKVWVVAAGLFNIIAATPLAIPKYLAGYYALFNSLNRILNLGGNPLVPPADATNSLFVNMAGLALILVGIILLYSAFDLKRRLFIPFASGLVRLVFSAVLTYYIFAENVAHILISIGTIDLLLGIVFVYYYLRLRKLANE